MPIKTNQKRYRSHDQSISNLLVEHVISEARSGSLPLGDEAGDLLDGVNLLVKELALEEVTEMSITVRGLVHVKKALVDSLLKLKCSLESVHRASPLHGAGLGDVLEDDLATSLVLILDQFLPMLPLLVGRFLEEGGQSGVGDIIPVKVGEHRHVDIAGVELHVDLLIDQSLALLLVVLSDPGNHLGGDVVSDSFPVCEFSFVCCALVLSLKQLVTNLCKCWKVTPM